MIYYRTNSPFPGHFHCGHNLSNTSQIPLSLNNHIRHMYLNYFSKKAFQEQRSIKLNQFSFMVILFQAMCPNYSLWVNIICLIDLLSYHLQIFGCWVISMYQDLAMQLYMFAYMKYIIVCKLHINNQTLNTSKNILAMQM